MSNIGSKKINTKIFLPIILIVIIVGGYFLYNTIFISTEAVLDNANNAYVSKTKVGQYIDILNKENLVFNTNINNELIINAKDFSVNINPSGGIGRKNPFLP